MAIDVPGDLPLTPISGETRTLSEYTTMFHLVLAVLDPYTYESGWIIDTAGRIFRGFGEADCRMAFLVVGAPDEAKQFLGPWSKEFLTFSDPDRIAVKGLGLERLPALVHLDQNHAIEGKAEGWHPEQWRAIAEKLAKVMSWRRPTVPIPDDPVPFDGTPALG